MNSRLRFWLASFAAAITVVLTASLGMWQVSRGAQKQALANDIAARGAQPELANADLTVDDDASVRHLHRRAAVRGTWVTQASVFLDNRPMAGRSGFILVTPLKLAGSDRVLLVQRGWVPRDFQDRTRVPEIATPGSEVEVVGRVAPPPSRLFELGPVEQGRIRQNLDVGAMTRETGLSLLSLSLLQTGASPEGLLREWPRFESAADKHHAYAAQWFAMSAITTGLYVWFQLISPRRRRKLHGQDSR